MFSGGNYISVLVHYYDRNHRYYYPIADDDSLSTWHQHDLPLKKSTSFILSNSIDNYQFRISAFDSDPTVKLTCGSSLSNIVQQGSIWTHCIYLHKTWNLKWAIICTYNVLGWSMQHACSGGGGDACRVQMFGNSNKRKWNKCTSKIK